MKSLAVASYCMVLLVLGYLASRRMHTIRDYFAGGKNLGFINIAFSSRATGESAWLMLGLTGTGFAFGVQGFWIVLGELLGVAAAWLLLARRFKRLTDRYDSVTIPDYLEARFRDSGHWLRLIAAGALIVFVPIYAGSQVFATGKAFNSFLDMNHFLGATIGFLVVLLYITKGGFVAVVWSDVFQGLLMVSGLVLLPIVGLLEAGGVSNIVTTLTTSYPAHLSATFGEGWTSLTIAKTIGFAAIGIGFLGSPQVFVRFIALRSESELRRGAVVALTWTLLADAGAVLVGLTGRALFTSAQIGGDPDNILPFMSQALLPSFVAGFYIAMVLAAIMSTIDSLLVVASSAGVRDYWQKTRHPAMPDDTLLRLSQRATLVLALLAYAIGMGILLHDAENGVFWIIIFGWSGIAATFCPVIILSLYWRRLTALAAKLAMVAGFLAVPLFKFAAPPLLQVLGWTNGTAYLEALDVLFPAFLVSGLVAIMVSLLDHKGQLQLDGVAVELDAAGKRL
ncbi:MAG: sodium/proline symporter [Pseudomonadales bacterium]|nr:sodium/proline symporter [Pseudomonadales bacterium]